MSYPKPFRDLYQRFPDLQLKPYADQKQALFQEGYVYSNGFSSAMEALGHEAHEILFDLPALQQAWAREHGVRSSTRDWRTEIVLAQIESLRPDIIYFQGVNPLPVSIRGDLKTLFPFIKLVVFYEGSPTAVDRAAGADVVLVATPTMAKQFRTMGLDAHLVYHAFDKGILDKMRPSPEPESNPAYDFTFVGSSGIGYGTIHQVRYWALVALAQRTNLRLWVNEGETRDAHMPIRSLIKLAVREPLKRALGRCSAPTIQRLLHVGLLPRQVKGIALGVAHQKENTDSELVPTKPLREMFPQRCERPVFGVDMYRVLQRSKVTFNIHTGAAVDCVGNMRMFEATGVGTCLMTDSGTNMPDLFEADREVVTYSSTEECIEKLSHLLEHDETRRRIAAAGQKRTLRDHTIDVRCQQINDILQKKVS